MNDDHRRRLTDSGVLRWIPLWPVFTGLVMACVAVGGYIATIKYIALDNKMLHDDLKSIHQWINLRESWESDKSGILEKIVAIQESQEKRMKRLEDHEDENRSWFKHRP